MTENIQNTFPQHLCKMCGRCCKAIIPEYNYEELLELAKDGDKEAKVFVEFFNRYASIEDASTVVPEHVEQILRELKQQQKDFDLSKISFYHCPHISEKNSCTIHRERPDCCRRAPRHGWSLMPPGCGFEGWQFELREKAKKNIRNLKEYLREMEVLYGEGPIPSKNLTVAELRKLLDDKISPWERYGAKYW